ncbi:unnamed protein product [Aureobasidium mustum]|uniref:Uncharacterized protein n=1 Tax=Aureobasidium mustum TaxID=2773714 RepID=A0A9N8JMH8_9PEZI|nr:unnamed protein product [Aureobasidium mustum]
MAITETIKHAVGLEAGPSTSTSPPRSLLSMPPATVQFSPRANTHILQPALHPRSSIGMLES